MIYIDASRYNNTSQRTGVENYSYFLVNELVRQFGSQITLITPRKIDLKLAQRVIPFPRLWTHLRLSAEVLMNKNIQTLFIPSHVLPLIFPKKSVITIHDVAFKHSPQSYPFLFRAYLDWSTRYAVKHAYKIITPSQKTKSDLVQLYHCLEEKIVTLPLGYQPPSENVKNSETEDYLKHLNLQSKKYFLYVGRIEHKKNSDTLIKAFTEFTHTNSEIKLCLAGFPGYGGEEILKMIPEKLKTRVVLPGYVDEKEKQILFSQASCFVFPSREEGFGLPLLEAIYYHLPIIASDIPTSREIADSIAHFFPPEEMNALKNLFLKISGHPSAIDKKQYDELLQKYSWPQIAEQTFRLLNAD